MGLLELFLLAVGLSMDAFAVSICKGISIGRAKIRHALIAGLWFGAFQALMPAIGFFLGVQFERYIQTVDHWIAFLLLAMIGINMIREGVRGEEEESDPSVSARAMFPLAVATSIDALASGVVLSAAGGDILWAALFIGLTTFSFSFAGVKAGSGLGSAFGAKAQIAGGAVLCIIGLRILIQHLLGGI